MKDHIEDGRIMKDKDCCRCDVELPNGKVCCHVHQSDPTKCPKFDKPSKDSWEAQVTEQKKLTKQEWLDLIDSIKASGKDEVKIKDLFKKAIEKDETIVDVKTEPSDTEAYINVNKPKEILEDAIKYDDLDKLLKKYTCKCCGKEVPFDKVCKCGHCSNCECSGSTPIFEPTIPGFNSNKVANSKDEAISCLEDLAKEMSNKYTCAGCGKELPFEKRCKCADICSCKNYCNFCQIKNNIFSWRSNAKPVQLLENKFIEDLKEDFSDEDLEQYKKDEFYEFFGFNLELRALVESFTNSLYDHDCSQFAGVCIDQFSDLLRYRKKFITINDLAYYLVYINNSLEKANASITSVNYNKTTLGLFEVFIKSKYGSVTLYTSIDINNPVEFMFTINPSLIIDIVSTKIAYNKQQELEALDSLITKPNIPFVPDDAKSKILAQGGAVGSIKRAKFEPKVKESEIVEVKPPTETVRFDKDEYDYSQPVTNIIPDEVKGLTSRAKELTELLRSGKEVGVLKRKS